MPGFKICFFLYSRKFPRYFTFDLDLEAFSFHFHFSISISSHFYFTFISRSRSQVIIFSLALLEKSEWHFFFTFHFSIYVIILSVACVLAGGLVLVEDCDTRSDCHHAPPGRERNWHHILYHDDHDDDFISYNHHGNLDDGS